MSAGEIALYFLGAFALSGLGTLVLWALVSIAPIMPEEYDQEKKPEPIKQPSKEWIQWTSQQIRAGESSETASPITKRRPR